MKMTVSAMKFLAMVLTSCRTFDEKKVDNLNYLLATIRQGREVEIGDFTAKLPQKSHMYSSIMGFATISGNREITEEVIVRYFGGSTHITSTTDEINIRNLRRLEGGFADKFLLAHTLVSASFEPDESGFHAVYEIDGKTVRLKNLIIHPFVSEKLIKGQKIFVHYATIVGASIADLERWLMEEQSSSPDLMSAVTKVEEIDYQTFWSLKQWTEDLINSCEL